MSFANLGVQWQNSTLFIYAFFDKSKHRSKKSNSLSKRKNVFKCSQLGFSGIQGLSLPPRSISTSLAQVKLLSVQKPFVESMTQSWSN